MFSPRGLIRKPSVWRILHSLWSDSVKCNYFRKATAHFSRVRQIFLSALWTFSTKRDNTEDHIWGKGQVSLRKVKREAKIISTLLNILMDHVSSLKCWRCTAVCGQELKRNFQNWALAGFPNNGDIHPNIMSMLWTYSTWIHWSE